MKLDIACGNAKPEGWTGIDICGLPGVDIVHDLRSIPWPIESESVCQARCSHYFEHVRRMHRPLFMGELWRVLEMGASVTMQTPLGLHRQFQDFTHEWPVFIESYHYFNLDWLRKNNIGHYIDMYGIRCNFRIVDALCGVETAFEAGTEEQKQFVARNYVCGGSDLIVTLEKLPL